MIDTLGPADNKPRTWRHPWQLGLNAPNIALRGADRSTNAIAPGAALQISINADGSKLPHLEMHKGSDSIAKTSLPANAKSP